MTAKVFITGGSGLLALNWALAIRESHTVTLGLHERIVSLAGVQTQIVDLESVEGLVQTFNEAQISMVVHTAGFTSVEQCEAKPDLAGYINVDLAGNVAKACAKIGLPLIHISTDHLFSGEMPLLAEISHVTPVNVYGRTKAEAELRVLDVHPEALVLRTNFYGWGTSYRLSFSDIIVDKLRDGQKMILFQDVFYTPILIETVVQVANELVKLKARGVFNVVGDERISKHDFGLKLAQEFNLDKDFIQSGYIGNQVSLVQRPHDMSLSNQKVSKLLGRKLGGLSEHLSRLHKQEQNGFAQEMRSL
jgi:dTDP-4-dehydrorhamnose reductase